MVYLLCKEYRKCFNLGQNPNIVYSLLKVFSALAALTDASIMQDIQVEWGSVSEVLNTSVILHTALIAFRVSLMM